MPGNQHLLGVLVASACLLAGCQPPPPPVDGWRPLSSDEVKELSAARLARDPPDEPFVPSVRGDFNADGKRDRVVVLVNETQDRFAPYLFDGAGAEPVQLVRGDSRKLMANYSLAVVPFNIVHGFCQEAADQEQECERYKELSGPFIVFFEGGRSGSTFAWDGSSYAEYPMPKRLYD